MMTPEEEVRALRGYCTEVLPHRGYERIATLGLKVCDALEAARRERDEAVAELENDQAEEHQLILRQGELLTGVVNALRGDPAPLHLHSHHDAAELASEVLAERDEALAHIAELESQGAPPWK